MWHKHICRSGRHGGGVHRQQDSDVLHRKYKAIQGNTENTKKYKKYRKSSSRRGHVHRQQDSVVCCYPLHRKYKEIK